MVTLNPMCECEFRVALNPMCRVCLGFAVAFCPAYQSSIVEGISHCRF